MTVSIVEPVPLLPVLEYGLLWSMRVWVRPIGRAQERIETLFADLEAPAGAAELDRCMRVLVQALGRPIRVRPLGDPVLGGEEAALLDAIAWQGLRESRHAVEALGQLLPRDLALQAYPPFVGLVHVIERAGLSLTRRPTSGRDRGQAPPDHLAAAWRRGQSAPRPERGAAPDRLLSR